MSQRLGFPSCKSAQTTDQIKSQTRQQQRATHSVAVASTHAMKTNTRNHGKCTEETKGRTHRAVSALAAGDDRRNHHAVARLPRRSNENRTSSQAVHSSVPETAAAMGAWQGRSKQQRALAHIAAQRNREGKLSQTTAAQKANPNERRSKLPP